MIYVTSDRSDSVYVIDGKTNQVVTSFEVLVPCGIAVNPATGMVYVTNQESHNESVIDGKNNKMIETIPVTEPFELAINSKTNKLYSMYTGSKLSVISNNPTLLKLLDSPLKQTAKGVESNLIECNGNFELIFKATDSSPACVKPTTAVKLIQIGWARE